MPAPKTATPIERVLPRVEEDNNGCWIFTGALSSGYGVINIRHKLHYTHRVSYAHYVGTIPAGLTIDHLCRVTACCNPEHLEPVTIGENVRRAHVKSHCSRDHEFTSENTYIRPDNGRRQCRACIAIRQGRAT